MQRRFLFLLLFLVLLAAGTACNSSSGIGPQPTQSLKGGVEVLLQASCDLPSHHCSSNELALLTAIPAILQGRMKDGLGVSQPIVHQQGNDQILVDLPRLPNTPDAVALLARTGKVEFIDTGPLALTVGTVVTPGQYPARFTGGQLDPNSINATLDQQSGQPIITFQFKSQAQTDFANYTQQNIGNYLTITLDNKVIESAVIQSQITGQGQIASGNMTLAQAQQTAALLRYGSLPLPLTIVSQNPITT